MQKYKVSFKGQNIYVGIDVHFSSQPMRQASAVSLLTMLWRSRV